jgi:FtsZ-interacting cell division protein ZipA
LDPGHMDGRQYKGLSLFAVIPGPLPAIEMLDQLVELAQGLALRLDAQVQDEYGRALNAERLIQLRNAVQAIGDGA